MRLAEIPFTNSLPFFAALDPFWLKQQQIVRASPRKLGELARAGKVDAGLFSLADCNELKRFYDFEFVGNLGIAGLREIKSILLLGADHLKECENQRVAITEQTATSVYLLEMLLKKKFKIRNFELIVSNSTSGLRLLIGDNALKQGYAASEPRVDLSACWYDWQNLPFVFARWMVRRSLPTADKLLLHNALEKSLKKSLNELSSLSQRQAESLKLPPLTVLQYLMHIRYSLGDEDLQAQQIFLDWLNKYHPPCSPLSR